VQDDKRYFKTMLLITVFALALVPALTALGQQRGETLAWAPKPVKGNPWVAPNKPHWKLTRLAMNGYPDMLHNYQPSEEMR
jgi:hypothetical protein